MFPAQRRREIAKRINENGYVSIAELCEQYRVSEMTVHRDLCSLEEMGRIKKTRGGAISRADISAPVSYRARMAVHEDLKDRIGRKAAEMIHNGETIFLDASTTCMYIAKNLQNVDRLTVYTNGPMVAIELAEKEGVEVYSISGALSKETMALVGPSAENALCALHPDKCFIGALGISLEEGVMDPYFPEASVKRVVVNVSQEVFLVATADKFNQYGPHLTAPLEMIDVIITDGGIEDRYIDAFSKTGIRCLVV
jgi:DeoR/GlpR family transcriptional regulator of sugar metabolism